MVNKMEKTALIDELLQGQRGTGVQYAMEILLKMGELYGVRRFLPVQRAHIDAAAYTTIWDAGREFIEFLVDNNARVAVPTTINPISRDRCNWRAHGISEAFALKSERLETAYLRLGVIPTWTCAPYQCMNVPAFGEVVSWSESNAVNFVNSVLGARAERLPDLLDVCCAVTGLVPEYGLYLQENRAGDILFDLENFPEDSFQDSVMFALLGYLVGEIAINRVPVIRGLPGKANRDQLKALSAAAASGGATALFHIIGVTPEAHTLEEAFQGRTEYPRIVLHPDDLLRMQRRLNTAEQKQVDMVLLGCPHLSFTELQMVAETLGRQHVHENTQLWLQTSHTIYEMARIAGIIDILEQAGALVIRDSCLMEMEYSDRWRGKHFVTDSGKVAQYAPAINGARITMASLPDCIRAAVAGRLPEGGTT